MHKQQLQNRLKLNAISITGQRQTFELLFTVPEANGFCFTQQYKSVVADLDFSKAVVFTLKAAIMS